VNPRLAVPLRISPASTKTTRGFIELQLDAGEIDVVVSAPLTEPKFEIVDYNGRPIRVETSTEAIAKKMRHRAMKQRHAACATLGRGQLWPQGIDIALSHMERQVAPYCV
jgi:hypothetical protein